MVNLPDYNNHPDDLAHPQQPLQYSQRILLVEQFLDFALSVGDYFYVMETGRIVMEGEAGAFDKKTAKEYLSV